MAEPPDLERRLTELSRRTGYKVWTRYGQMIFGGPPPGWNGDSEPERGTEVYPVSLQIFPGNGTNGHTGLVPPNWERIQKSDSIIEMREKGQAIPAFERIQKSNSVVEVVPVRKLTAPIQAQQPVEEMYSPPNQYLKEASPYSQQPQDTQSAFKPSSEGSAFKRHEPAAKELSPSMTNTGPTTTISSLSSPDRGHDISSSFSSESLQGE